MSAYAIWYMKPEWFRDGMVGRKPDPANLKATHVFLKTMDVEDDDVDRSLERIYMVLNSDPAWYAEARKLIPEKGLSHSSMSVGDVVVRDGDVYVVASFGFEKIGEMPGCDWVSHAVSTSSTRSSQQ